MKVSPLSKGEYRRFGLVMALFIAMVFGLFIPWFFDAGKMRLWPWSVSCFFGVWSFVWPTGLRVIHQPWMAVGRILGVVNTTVVLSLIYFLFLTPMALIFRWTGKDPMERDFNGNIISSYWKPSKKQPREHMENLY